MRIVFLDIDGVLATLESISQGGCPPQLDRDCVQRLLRLCETETGQTRVVISSSWRYIYTQEEVFEQLEQAGLSRHFIDPDWRTVRLEGDDTIRGDEIAEWLSRHPEVAEFVILDDDDDFTFDQRNRHVRTEFELGLTEDHLGRARKILRGSTRL